ncbi:EH signature domain-containing protein [Pseudomonas aeruginosa]|nr:EH signature domain-containing protein [Pseudomonas aeruginosa]
MAPQADPLVTLKRDAHWLLPPDGPVQLVERVRDSGHELGETFEVMGLQGFDDGRYGDICRAHFYLETLRGLAPGEYDPVLDELQKPAVSKAPYEGERRIGHVALEILIDRAGQEPGEVWQNFILNLAGGSADLT